MIKRLLAVCLGVLLMGLAGCSGGGSGRGGTVNSILGGSSVQVRVAVAPFLPARTAAPAPTLAGITSLQFHVVNPSTQADIEPVGAPVPVNGAASVTTTLTVPTQTSFEIVVDAFAAGTTPIGQAVSNAITLQPGETQTVTLTIQPAQVATQLVFSTTLATTQALSPIQNLTVVVEDANGQIVTGANVPVTLTLQGGGTSGAVLGGTTQVTSVNGTATFNNVTVSVPGSAFTLTASSPGLTSATSNPFDVTAFTPLVGALYVGNPATRSLSAFVRPTSPVGTLTPLPGFVSPVLSSPPVKVVVNAGNSIIYVGEQNGNIEQFRVSSTGAVAQLTTAVTPGGAPVTSMGFGASADLWVTTSAPSNNVATYPFNADGSIASTPDSVTSVGGPGNTPVFMGGFSFTPPSTLVEDVLCNGGTNNVTRIVITQNSNGTVASTQALTPITIGGPGNTPIAVGLSGFTEFFVSNGTSNNITGTNIFNQAVNVGPATISTSAPVVASVTPGNSSFFYVLTGDPSGNLISVPIGQGFIGTPAAAVTVGGAGNVPVSVGPAIDHQFPTDGLFVTTSGATNNVNVFQASNAVPVLLGTGSAAGPGPVGPDSE